MRRSREQERTETGAARARQTSLSESFGAADRHYPAQKEGNALEKHPCYPDMCELLRELDAMAAKLKALKTTVRKNQNQITERDKELDAMTEKLRDVETRLQDSENQILELKNKEQTKVIFSAAVGGPDSAVGPFNTATTLIYRTVITNIGNAYSSATGIFTAPVAGVYYFTFFYHADGRHRAFLLLFKNSQKIVDSSDHASSFDKADNGGNAVILQLQQGDQVFMRMEPNTHVWGNPCVTTFSGYLITAM
ncbi:complement C1q-like protein 2 [Cheilinus undulatus]|uniref:complement C1q-like protein 2 n=1 Tax=Cheilinus undulatus TaxID=241271 RepID=UPI001BD4BAA9|nr:complement C1q-like protein 2 [Cheilinus undulatus]